MRMRNSSPPPSLRAQAEASCKACDVAFQRELLLDPQLPGFTERAAPRRLADQAFERARHFVRGFRRNQQPGRAMLDELRNPRYACSDAGEGLALGLG